MKIKARIKNFIFGFVAGVIVLGISIWIILCNMNLALVGESVATTSDSAEQSMIDKDVIRKLQLLENSVNTYYLGTVSENEMEDAIYKGYMEGVGDPYSTYYNKEDLQQVMESAEGVYFGVGSYVGKDLDSGYCKFTKVMDGSPAKEAGVQDGDIIVEVDGEDMTGITTTDIVSKIKGPENTEVDVKVFREGEIDYLDFTLTRRKIEAPTVVYNIDENKIATIQIVEFDEVTIDQFRTQIEQAEKDGMKGLVLDLRDNPGGSLATVIDIAEHLLPKGLIVYTEDKSGKRNEYHCDGKHEIQVPMVVLVNENSASASEILAGAIKDYRKGTVLGTTTFGKGIVQKIFNISDGTAVKLTISHYYTPNGNDIHKVGIEPDEILELDFEAYIDEGTDNQMDRAKEILLNQ